MRNDVHIHLYQPSDAAGVIPFAPAHSDPMPPPGDLPGDFAPLAEAVATGASVPAFGGILAGLKRQPLRDRLRAKLVDDAMTTAPKGTDRAAVESAVEDLVGEHPILDLLMKIDWAKIIQLVLQLLVVAA